MTNISNLLQIDKDLQSRVTVIQTPADILICIEQAGAKYYFYALMTNPSNSYTLLDFYARMLSCSASILIGRKKGTKSKILQFMLSFKSRLGESWI